jgi:hypothetical protein
MIDRKALLADLQRWVTKFEQDLRARCVEVPELDASLHESYHAVKRANRTAETYELWREGQLTQSAVGWVLACVFVRFLEDNALLDRPFIGGAGERRAEAEHVRDEWFRRQPALSDRDYLQFVFEEVGHLPGMADLFDRRHNPLWRAGISGDAAGGFIAFWRKGEHDFEDREWDTRFLGDLYQDLSEAARKQFALLQTPALETFGYEHARLIDPTCGSGHFVLGAFRRLLARWRAGHPEMNEREVVLKVLAGVAGVDLNPFAVAIARFRLLLEAWKFCRNDQGTMRLRGAPDFKVNLAVGDSLYHGPHPGEIISVEALRFRIEAANSTYSVELPHELARVLAPKYHAVVGNPPYITVKDRALSESYRGMFGSCSGKYSLSVPFMERFFDFAVKGDGTPREPAGFVGQITANSFMKREFGKKLIETFLPRWDLTHVLDTSGAHIPGHGTPTVILFGRNQPPVRDTIRTVLGIKGEPTTPTVPSKGLVWRAICQQIDQSGSVSQWVSAADSLSEHFHKHPWSIGGGGAAELKEQIDTNVETTLGQCVENIGICAVTLEDDAFTSSVGTFARHDIPSSLVVPFVEGDAIRHWSMKTQSEALFPYDPSTLIPLDNTLLLEFLWPLRTTLRNRIWFRKTQEERGLRWFEYGFLSKDQFRAPGALSFAFVATHNNFVLQDEPCVFNRSSPTIRFNETEARTAHRSTQLLGTLNSALGCFWMKQVMSGKHKGDGGEAHASVEGQRFEFDGTKLASFPVPTYQPTQLPAALVAASTELQSHAPAAVLAALNLRTPAWLFTGDEHSATAPERSAVRDPRSATLPQSVAAARAAWHATRQRMISLQEELDWQIYAAFGLIEPADALHLPEGDADTPDAAPPIAFGERAFEFVLARRMAAGEEQTTWFERHGAVPQTDLPARWPAAYRARVERRIARIADDANIRLIERPEYKRRWNTEPWDDGLARTARDWLLVRLETVFFGGERMTSPAPSAAPMPTASFSAGSEPRLVSTRQLADAIAHDADFLRVAAVYRGREDFDVPRLVRDLVEEESVPFLPALRYKESGRRKRVQWERTWDLQREEDRLAALRAAGQTDLPAKPDIPVPPKYGSGDFKKTSYWRLCGKLDVPKERWIIYPGAERQADPASVIAWAGWDHRQQAQALAGYYQERKDGDGWTPERLIPLLAGLKDLLPWLKQWHNQIDAAYGLRLGDFYEEFVRSETHALGLSDALVEAVRTGY